MAYVFLLIGGKHVEPCLRLVYPIGVLTEWLRFNRLLLVLGCPYANGTYRRYMVDIPLVPIPNGTQCR